MAIIHTVTVNLEIDKPNDLTVVHAVQGEYYTRQVTANLFSKGIAYQIPAEAVALIRYRKPDGTVGFYDFDPDGNRIVTIPASPNNVKVIFTLAPEMCDLNGRVYANIDLYSLHTGYRLSVFNFIVDVEKAATDNEVMSETDVSGLESLIGDIITNIYRGNEDTDWRAGIIDNTLTIEGAVGEAKAMGEVILVQPEEPDPEDYPSNKIWIDSDSYEDGIEVPTVIEMETITNSLSAQINTKAPIASPNFTGTPTTPDQSSSDNSNKIANTKFVHTAVNAEKARAMAVEGTKANLDAYPHATASGTIASFTDGADNIPMRELIIGIEPVQDLHGYDHPWPAGGGKNLYNSATFPSVTHNGVTCTNNGDGSFTLNGTASADTFFDIFYNQFNTNSGGTPLPSAKYRLTGVPSGAGSSNFYVYTVPSYGGDRGNGQTFTNTVAGGSIFIKSGTTMNNVTIWPMIRLADNGDDTFAPYSNICPISGWTECNVWVQPTHDTTADPTVTIDLDGTRYGGTLDVLTGVLTVDRAIVTYNSADGFADHSSGRWYHNGLPSGADYAKRTDAIANQATYSDSTNTYRPYFAFGSVGVYINKLDAAETIEEFDARLIEDPFTICYELATPQTVQLTPIEVTTLLGQNNVWADTGDIKRLVYYVDPNMAADKKQDVLTFDSVPTENSTNPVTSGGLYTAFQSVNTTLNAVQAFDEYISLREEEDRQILFGSVVEAAEDSYDELRSAPIHTAITIDGSVYPRMDNTRMAIDKMLGRTVAFNQLVNSADMPATLGLTLGNDGYWTGAVTTVTQYSYKSLINPDDIPLDHIIYVVAEKGSTAAANFNIQRIAEVPYESSPCVYKNTSANKAGIFIDWRDCSVGDVVKFKAQYIDLTAMWGATIADAVYAMSAADAVAYVRARLPLDYYAPNTGTLTAPVVSGWSVSGFNQWDEQWENGTINQYTGANRVSGDAIRPKNYIPVIGGTNYYIKAPKAVRAYWYDASTNYLGTDSISYNAVFSIPASAAFMRFSIGSTSSPVTSYDNNICINISNASLNGTYRPYVAPNTLTIPSTRLDGVGTAQDYIVAVEVGENDYSLIKHSLTGTRAYESGDESLAGAITDGTNTVYTLATPTQTTVAEHLTLAEVSAIAQNGGIIGIVNANGDIVQPDCVMDTVISRSAS